MMRKVNPILSLAVPALLGAGAYAIYKWVKPNLPAKEKPHSDAPIIACLGDSITFGAGVVGSRKTDTWEALLENRLAGRYQVLNYGISGATLQNEGDFPYWQMKIPFFRGFPEAALGLDPEIVILMLGSNDSKPYNWNPQRYQEQLYARVRQIMDHGSVRRMILMCPPFATIPQGKTEIPFDIQNDVIRDQIVPMVRACAEELGAECIDLYALTEGHGEYYCDGVHPNRLGNEVIAGHIARHITEGSAVT